MWTWILRWIDRLLVVLGALLFLQMPVFMQQYELQLAGHRDELQYQVAEMQKAASHSGKNLDNYIKKFIASEDVDFARQGEIMSAMLLRWQNFSEAAQALKKSSVWSHPFVFVKYLNYEIAKSTLQTFRVGISLTYEGIIYGLIGMFAGYFCFACLRKFVSLFLALFSRKKKTGALP